MSPKNDGQQRFLYVFMCFLIELDCYVSARKCLRNGLYEHPTDCAKYYSCAPFGPVMMHCPGGLHFNPELLICDWPQYAECRSEKPDKENECPLYPHPHDCTKFYSCAPTGRVLMDCPKGLHFNPQLLVCDWPTNVECSNTSHPGSTIASSTEALAEPTRDTTITTAESDAGGNSDTYTTTTGGNTYDTSTQVQTETEINFSTTSSLTTTNPSIITTTYVTTNSSNVCTKNAWPHPTDCGKFLMASPVGNIELSCPSGLLFNSALLVCDLASNIECQGTTELSTSISTTTYFDSSTSTDIEETTRAVDYTTTPLSTGDYSETTNRESLNNSQICKGSLWPHPTECAKFFMCSSTGPVEVVCPEKLLFNPISLVCDWPINFECSENPPGITDLSTATEEMEHNNSFETSMATDASISTNTGEMSTLGYPDFDFTTSRTETETVTIEDTSISTFPTKAAILDYTATGAETSTAESEDDTTVNKEESSATLAMESTSPQLCKGGLWPHPTDCSKFFMCGSTGPVEVSCPEDLLFNPTLLICDWPKNVECHEGPAVLTDYAYMIDSNRDITTQAYEEDVSSTVKEEKTSTTLTTSYSEIGTGGYKETESYGLTIELDQSTIDYQEESSVSPTVELSTENQICKGSLWPHPTDCTKFFKCDSSGPVEVQCPEELLFNPALLICDWSKNVECHEAPAVSTHSDASTKTTEQATFQTTTSAYDYEKTVSTMWATETDHSSIETTNLTANLRKISIIATNYSELSTESNKKTELDETTTASRISAEESTNESQPCEGNLWPHPTDCTKYLKCGSTGPVEIKCPGELLFSPTLLVCDWPKDSGCIQNSTADNSTYLVDSSLNEQLTKPGSSTISITNNMETITQIYSYLSSATVEPSSSDTVATIPGMEEHSTLKPNSSQTATASVAVQEASTISATESSEAKNSTNLCKGNLWPHPTDCTKYLKCGSTGPVAIKCPGDLLFSPTLLVCDWPKDSGCIQNSTADNSTHLGDSSLDEDDEKFTAPDLSTIPTTHIMETITQSYGSSDSDLSSANVEPSSSETVASIAGMQEHSTLKPNSSQTATASVAVQEVSTITTTESSEAKNNTNLCKGNLWPHPTDCTKYLKCSSTGPVEIKCPGELLFNPTLLVCDWPKDSGCIQNSTADNSTYLVDSH